MFEGSVPYYDRIYADKDYEGEARKLRALITTLLGAERRRLLDVACGTGRHLAYLGAWFEAEGLDLSAGLLEVARRRNPTLTFHEGDMEDFDLHGTYDVLTCLFSAIGYLKTLEQVERTARTFRRHLVPGGVALVEPWFTPDAWRPHTVHALYVDEPELKLARVNTSLREGRLSILDLHHLVGTPEETVHFVERHEMGLFETAELLDAFRRAGFETDFDDEGLTGRGLLVARRREGGEARVP